MNIRAFNAIIDKNTKILILGSMPSVKSLEINQYYGNPRNQFWKLIYLVFDEEIQESYTDKIKFLLKNKIGIWDVISECYREGSMDSNIKNPRVNDFASFFKTYNNIEYLFFNGSKAEQLFMKKIDKDILYEKKLFKLPSSSPARAIPIDEKLKYWSRIRECL